MKGTVIKQNTKGLHLDSFKKWHRLADLRILVCRLVKYASIYLAWNREGHLSKSSLSRAQHKLTNLHVLE